MAAECRDAEFRLFVGMERDEPRRLSRCEQEAGAHERRRFAALDIHFHDRRDVGIVAKDDVVQRVGADLFSDAVERDAARGRRRTGGERRGATASCSDALDDVNVAHPVDTRVEANPVRISRIRLDRDHASAWTDRARQEQGVIADVRADIKRGGSLSSEPPDRALFLELVASEPASVIRGADTPLEPAIRSRQDRHHGRFWNRVERSAQKSADSRATINCRPIDHDKTLTDPARRALGDCDSSGTPRVHNSGKRDEPMIGCNNVERV